MWICDRTSDVYHSEQLKFTNPNLQNALVRLSQWIFKVYEVLEVRFWLQIVKCDRALFVSGGGVHTPYNENRLAQSSLSPILFREEADKDKGEPLSCSKQCITVLKS